MKINWLLAVMLTMLTSMTLKAETISLSEANTVYLKEAVSSESMTRVISELSQRENNEEPVIYLVLQTPGGSVFAGLNLIHYLKGYKKPIKTITVFSASMGFQIVQGNPGDRLILDTGILMSHPMSGGFAGEIGEGLNIENRTKYIKEIIDTLDQQVVQRSKGKVSLGDYKKAYDNELWTTGKSAVDSGYADAVVGVECSSQLVSSVDRVNTREWMNGSPLVMEVEYETSKCPLMTSVLRYQVRVVNLVTGAKYIVKNNGYEIPSDTSASTDQSNRLSVDMDQVNKTIEKNDSFKNLMFLINKNYEVLKVRN
jgi:ATP-dependent Clp protease protease subunit